MYRFVLKANGASRIWALALVAGAALCCLMLPPLLAFRAQPLPALAAVAIGGVALLWPQVRPPRARLLSMALLTLGALLLWASIAWCVLSQVAQLTQPRSLKWSLRSLPIVVVAALWLWLMLSHAWQRRALLAIALPSLAGLVLVAWTSPAQPLDFQPYYVAVDSRGTIYVTDAASPVIRVFAPDGALRAKLRPGLASRQGPPGLGFSQPGPYNDPDRVGVPRAARGASSVSSALQPWASGTDDFWFCGLGVDSHDELYVPDWMRGRMLRFASDGRLVARWNLPGGYHPSLGCIATAPDDTLYLSDEHGIVSRLDANGYVLAHWTLPEAIVGGISVSPDGATLYALALTRVYRLDLRSAALTSWPLPAATGPLGRPYQSILSVSGSRVLVTNLAAHRVDVYCPAAGDVDEACGHIGVQGNWPGQFGQVGNMARDKHADVYIADFDHRVLQRFTPAGALEALYWGPDDDESE